MLSLPHSRGARAGRTEEAQMILPPWCVKVGATEEETSRNTADLRVQAPDDLAIAWLSLMADSLKLADVPYHKIGSCRSGLDRVM
jgi:hypothetical protein